MGLKGTVDSERKKTREDQELERSERELAREQEKKILDIQLQEVKNAEAELYNKIKLPVYTEGKDNMDAYLIRMGNEPYYKLSDGDAQDC